MEPQDETSWKDAYFNENVSVDQCLSGFTAKSDLESLRTNLKTYGNKLYKQMSEILKTETEAIVNLAEYLMSLSSKIDDLSLPISQLREEIKTLHDLLCSTEENYSVALEATKANNAKKLFWNLKQAIIYSSQYIDSIIESNKNDSFILERLVNKYSFEYNCLNECGFEEDLEEIHTMRRKLTDLINRVFIEALKKEDSKGILRCLRMYDYLRQHKEAEMVYRVNIVRPVLEKIYTESYLENYCKQEITQIYQESLDFIDNQMKTLLNILKRNEELSCFNFIVNSFWAEIEKQSREGLPHITAPGNPELFQKRFKATWNFLTNIAIKCGDPNLINNQSFLNHMKRFNLPVYFEICFQRIAGNFETEAVLKSDLYNNQNEINCSLRLTLALWNALLQCFHKEVFIEHLADQFLKLSMLLLARYLKCLETGLKEMDSSNIEAWEKFAISSINDALIIEKLIGYQENIPELVDSTVYKIMPITIKFKIENVLKLNSKTIKITVTKLQENVITLKTSESLVHLQNVASIPRLYRRTNRTVPQQASTYMMEAVSPIVLFAKLHNQNGLEITTDTIITNITNQYFKLVDEVLKSVCKTEESLRRLKNRNAQFSEFTDNEDSKTMTDEMKIREQIKLDVLYFVDNLKGIALSEGIKAMEQLKHQIISV